MLRVAAWRAAVRAVTPGFRCASRVESHVRSMTCGRLIAESCGTAHKAPLGRRGSLVRIQSPRPNLSRIFTTHTKNAS